MKNLINKLKKYTLETLYIKFLKLRPISFIIGFSQKIVLPGFDGMPFYNVALFFFKGIQKGYITQRASALSFNFFLALFPAILFIFTLIPYLPINNFQIALFEMLSEFLPQSAFETVKGTINDILTHKRTGLLSLGFLMTFYFSTNGVNAIIEAFNSTYHTFETRTWIKQRLISLFLVLVLSVLLVIAILLIILGSHIINFLAQNGILKGQLIIYTILIIKWLVIIALLFFGVSFLYYYAPARKSRFKFISAGSTLTTILIIITTMGFNYYVANFSKYNVLYGSIGTLIIVLMWIYINAIILLVGFELNASITNASRKS